MKKFTAFLEKYCQWVAIAAGGLYLLYMIYSFVLTNSAWQVQVGNEPRSPGEVDAAVAKIADDLKAKMDKGPKIEIKVPNFQTAIDLSPKPLPEFNLAWADSPTQDPAMPAGTAPTASTPPGVAVAPGQPNSVAAAKVVELPKAPPATDIAWSAGRSNVMIPPQVQPASLVSGAQPAAPVDQGGGAAAAPVQPAVATDTGWVTVSYKIPLQDLAREFQRTKIPNQTPFTTLIVDVQLLRQEKQSDGNWGGETVCQKLTTSTQPPFPEKSSSRQEMQGYLTWATSATSPAELLQPKFYDVVKGDPWALPKELIGSGIADSTGAPLPPLGPNDVRPGFDPTPFIGNDPKVVQQAMTAMNPPLTSAERRLISKARTDAKPKATPRAPTAPRGNGTGQGGGAGGGRGPGGAAAQFAPNDGGDGTGRPLNSRIRSEGPSNEGAAIMGGGAVAAPASSVDYTGKFPIPSGEFDPRALVSPPAGGVTGGNTQPVTAIVGWAHDWKPSPGKTYRYAIRYKLKNPVWASQNVTNPKALADQFAIVSDPSAWTPEVNVPSIVTFYFASGGGIGRSEAQVDVYRWQNGQNQKDRFRVAPGDSIGLEKNGVDFGTGFTLVDLRPEPRGDRMTAWLLGPDGMLTRRDIRTDMESPQHKEMDQQVSASAAAAAAATGAPGTAPPLINPTRAGAP